MLFRSRRMRSTTASIVVGFVALGLVGCNDAAFQGVAPVDAGDTPGLSPEQAQRVLAKVGERAITLGDYAKALDRMDQFDRLRYTTKERRKELLDAMVDAELLAEEARRRGLDKDPEVEDAVRQILRDAMLAEARKDVPAPASIPDADVRAYFERNQDKFSEPERRRVAAIVMKDKADAEKVLKEAQKAKDAKAWGELWLKHSMNAPAKPTQPLDLSGDLGIVGPMDDSRGANPKVPDAVRAEAFKIASVGEVAPELIESEGRYFIVRLQGKTPPHKRTLQEADRTIRVMIIQEKMKEAEDALEAELRKKFPITIDEKALADVKTPSALDKPDVSGASTRGAPGEEGDEGDAGAPANQADAGAAKQR